MTKEESKKTPKGRQTSQRATHKKVFDVVPPGKSVASPNSRSVIVGHKPPVKDDQFVPGGPNIFGTPSDSGTGASGVSDAKSDVATDGSTAKTDGHSLITSDPTEKRPLMNSHKRVSLSPTSDGVDSDSTAQVTTAPEVNAFVSTGVPGAPELKRGVSVQTKPAMQEEVPLSPPSDAPDGATNNAPGTPPLDSASEHLADLAVEQTVETETFNKTEHNIDGVNDRAAISNQSGVLDQPISGETEQRIGASTVSLQDTSAGAGVAPGRPATVDDLLADTGPPNITPHPQQAVVSHHRHRGGAMQAIMVILLVLILAVAALNFLLDAEIIKTSLDLPYTDLIN